MVYSYMRVRKVHKWIFPEVLVLTDTYIPIRKATELVWVQWLSIG